MTIEPSSLRLPALNAAIRALPGGADPGFVADLYARGAWLVLPARFGGCAGRGFKPRPDGI